MHSSRTSMINTEKLPTSVHPSGEFIWLTHYPSYTVLNLRKTHDIQSLGKDINNNDILNTDNFPQGDLLINNAMEIIEILNPFPFFGSTYIIKRQADAKCLPDLKPVEFPNEDPDIDPELFGVLLNGLELNKKKFTIKSLGRRTLLSLAQNSRSPEILIAILKLSCELTFDDSGKPIGMKFNESAPIIHDHELFDIVVNNINLPYEYKLATVLKPGIQGKNPIVGEYLDSNTHVWEYLRANSYIPWGHFASNMAHDAERYTVSHLNLKDMIGLRHLYYQRVYTTLASLLNLPFDKKPLEAYSDELEALREKILENITNDTYLEYDGTVWGWNYGFDYSSSGFRLNASHQQIHQQYALIKSTLPSNLEFQLSPFTMGDLIKNYIKDYKIHYNTDFFDAYLRAIKNNKRFDGKDNEPKELIIYEDDDVILFAPKAQRNHAELQIMTKKPYGNILLTPTSARKSIDYALYLAVKLLNAYGAKMITTYEVSSRFKDITSNQRLIYCLLPRHPQSPGAFNERLNRWVTGHYPEDFSAKLRDILKTSTF